MTLKENLDNLSFDKRWKCVFEWGILLAEQELNTNLKGCLFLIDDEDANSLVVEIQIENKKNVVSVAYGAIDDPAFTSKYISSLNKLIGIDVEG